MEGGGRGEPVCKVSFFHFAQEACYLCSRLLPCTIDLVTPGAVLPLTLFPFNLLTVISVYLYRLVRTT
jgi:hypothetical protein